MKRVLRITASAFFALASLALLLLWVRSYWYGSSPGTPNVAH